MRGRGKLVLFVAVLAAAGSFAGWEFSRDPQLFIGGRRLGGAGRRTAARGL